MDIILHTGTHRTASTTFQHYICANKTELRRMGIGVWGPKETRDGLLKGVIPGEDDRDRVQQSKRAEARISINLTKAKAEGIETLLISDENMIGAPRRNLRKGALYPDIGERMARFSAAFGGKINCVSFAIRSHESYWASALAFAVGRGHRLPSADLLNRLTTSRRMWRDVITDLACAMPDTKIVVTPYELFGGLPDRNLARITGQAAVPRRYAREWLNRAPSLAQLKKIVAERGGDVGQLPEGVGRWQPFGHAQIRAMRETYADDLFWLRAGADGLATLIEETGPMKTGKTPHTAQMTRGQEDGTEDRRMA